MRTKILAGVAVLGVVWAISCSTSSDGTNNGGNGGESGGSGGFDNSDGGKGGGGSAGKGGPGGKGGSGTAGSGSGGTAGSSGGAGGAGGNAGGASGGSGGAAFAAKHPTWDFEGSTDAIAWTNGVDHIGATGQCDHGRYAPAKPVVSTEQKKDGASSLMYEIDVAAAKVAYDALKCMECTATAGGDAGSDAMTCKPKIGGGIALIAASGPLNSWVQTKVLGKSPVLLPSGTVITFNVWFPGSKAPAASIFPYMLGVGAEWTQGGQAAFPTDTWAELTMVLPAARAVSSDWSELGLFVNGLPPDFKGKIYVDAVDIELP